MTPGTGRHHLSQRRRMKKWRSQRRPATALPWPRSPLMSWVYYFRSLAKWPNVCILKAFRTDWPRLTQIDPYHTIYTSYHKSHLIKKRVVFTSPISERPPWGIRPIQHGAVDFKGFRDPWIWSGSRKIDQSGPVFEAFGRPNRPLRSTP